jgi:hypothetical protein
VQTLFSPLRLNVFPSVVPSVTVNRTVGPLVTMMTTVPVTVPSSAPVTSIDMPAGASSAPSHVIPPDIPPAMVKAPVGGVGGVGAAGPDGIQSVLALVIIFSSQLKSLDSPLPRFFCLSLCSASVSLSSEYADIGRGGGSDSNAITIATTITVSNVGILVNDFIDLHKVVINNYIWIENENARFYGHTYGIIFN